MIVSDSSSFFFGVFYDSMVGWFDNEIFKNIKRLVICINWSIGWFGWLIGSIVV